MNEPAGEQDHIKRLEASARALHDAEHKLKQLRAAETAATKARKAQAEVHRAALDQHQRSIVDAYNAKVPTDKILEAGNTTRSWLYQVLKKLT